MRNKLSDKLTNHSIGKITASKCDQEVMRICVTAVNSPYDFTACLGECKKLKKSSS